jgi:nicotinamide riboside kinase
MLALTGAERTGKTTLAKAFAEASNIPFQPFNTSDIIVEMGLDITKPIDVVTRINLQERILKKHLAEIRDSPAMCITDRSTIDFAAYLITSIGNNCPEEYQDWVLDYVDTCIKHANNSYFGVIVVQPGIEYVEAENKPLKSKTRQELFNMTCMALVNDVRFASPAFYIKKDNLILTDRVASVGNILKYLIGNIPSLEDVTRH